MSAAATMTRADFRPGMVVERRERFLVRSVTYPSEGHAGRADRNGARKLTPLDGEWVIVRGRWSVRRAGPLEVRGAVIPAYWVAAEQNQDTEWSTFDTFAEAIAYADRKARER